MWVGFLSWGDTFFPWSYCYLRFSVTHIFSTVKKYYHGDYKKTKKIRGDADNEHDDIHVPIVQLMSESNKCRSCSKTEFYFTERCPK